MNLFSDKCLSALNSMDAFCEVPFSPFVILFSHDLIIIKGDYNPDPTDVYLHIKLCWQHFGFQQQS